MQNTFHAVQNTFLAVQNTFHAAQNTFLLGIVHITSESVEQIVDAIGGKENIAAATHYVTRLRFALKDEGKVDKEKLENIELVKGSFSANGPIPSRHWSRDRYGFIMGFTLISENRVLLVDDPQIFAYIRTWKNVKMPVINNFYDKEVTLNLPLEADTVNKNGNVRISNYPEKNRNATLRPYESIVYKWETNE